MLGAAAVALSAVAVWSVRPASTAEDPAASTDRPRAKPGSARAPAIETVSSAPAVEPARSTRRITANERTRLRGAIAQRAKAAARRGTRPSGGTRLETKHDSEAEHASAGSITDKSDGVLSDLMGDFGRDAMPLIDECYIAAVERRPWLRGGLDMNFQIVGDPEVGGLVDGFEVDAGSEIDDPDMIKCVRETIFSTVFPAPEEAGEAGVRLTMRFEPDEP